MKNQLDSCRWPQPEMSSNEIQTRSEQHVCGSTKKNHERVSFTCGEYANYIYCTNKLFNMYFNDIRFK